MGQVWKYSRARMRFSGVPMSYHVFRSTQYTFSPRPSSSRIRQPASCRKYPSQRWIQRQGRQDGCGTWWLSGDDHTGSASSQSSEWSPSMRLSVTALAEILPPRRMFFRARRLSQVSLIRSAQFVQFIHEVPLRNGAASASPRTCMLT